MKKEYQSEAEFLKDYNPKDFEQLSMTADILLISISDEETNNYIQQSNENYNDYINRVTLQMQEIKDNLKISLLNIREMDLYNDDVIPELENISRIFNMNIDFEREWERFLGVNNELLFYNTTKTL